jgi:NADH-quinone oxidoreductase subunit L
MHDGDRLTAFLAPVVAVPVHSISHSTEYLLMGLSTVLILISIGLAFSKYKRYKPESSTGLAKLLENKWYVDEIYDKIIVRPIGKLGAFLDDAFERSGIDAMVNGVGRAVQYSSRQLRLLQSGQVGNYVLLMVLSMLVLLVVQFFVR